MSNQDSVQWKCSIDILPNEIKITFTESYDPSNWSRLKEALKGPWGMGDWATFGKDESDKYILDFNLPIPPTEKDA